MKKQSSYQIKYAKKSLVRIPLDINRNTESDILEYLENRPNKSRYIKDLIKKDMEQGRKEKP